MRDQEYITPIDQYVIDFVRDFRIKKELTQETLGNIIGISRSFVRDIESIKRRAKFNLQHINALADYFEMSPKDFLPQNPLPLHFKGRERDEMKKKSTTTTRGKKATVKKSTKK